MGLRHFLLWRGPLWLEGRMLPGGGGGSQVEMERPGCANAEPHQLEGPCCVLDRGAQDYLEAFGTFSSIIPSSRTPWQCQAMILFILQRTQV